MSSQLGPPVWHDPSQLARFPVQDREPSVSVIVPHYRQVDELRRTLAALSAQAYPSDRLEIIVVDDGTEGFEPRSVAGPTGPFPLRLLEQPRHGFGLARARNLGARSATGDVLLFLDSDMLPVPGFIRAHVRPHERLDYAVVVGTRRHLDSDGVPDGRLLEGLQSAPDDLAGHLGVARQDEPPWRAQLLASWRDLEDPVAQPYRIASGGNLSIRRERYLEFGSTSERFVQWGGEDTEFAYRATQLGAFFVFARDALAWHQGLSKELSREERRSQAEQRDLLADLVPLPPFRSSALPRRYSVPLVVLELDAVGCEPGALLSFLDRLFERLPDAAVGVVGSDTSNERALDRAYSADTRVWTGIGRPWSGGSLAVAPLRGRASARGGSDTASEVVAAVEFLLDPRRPVGTCRGTAAELWLTAAEERLRRHGALADGSVPERVAEAFGAGTVGPSSGYLTRSTSAAGEGDIEAAVEVLRKLFWRLSPRLRRMAVVAINYSRRLLDWLRRRQAR